MVRYCEGCFQFPLYVVALEAQQISMFCHGTGSVVEGLGMLKNSKYMEHGLRSGENLYLSWVSVLGVDQWRPLQNCNKVHLTLMYEIW